MGDVVEIQEIAPGIVQITMKDEVHKNTFSEPLIKGLVQAFEAVQTNPNYKVAILTGLDFVVHFMNQVVRLKYSRMRKICLTS